MRLHFPVINHSGHRQMAFVLSLLAVCRQWGRRTHTHASRKASTAVSGAMKMCRRSPTMHCRHESLSSAQDTVTPVIWLPDERDTYKLGKLLGDIARTGDTLLLDGDLGAGKTCLARGYVHSARRDFSLQVTSPTYLLVNTYPRTSPSTRSNNEDPIPTIYHMDLWRLQDASARPIVDFDHLFSHAIALIEWPDRLGSKVLPKERLDITLRYPTSSSDGANIPARQIDGDAEDDGWGFEEVTRQGRIATLTPYGNKWIDRVNSLCEGCMERSAILDSVQYTLTDHLPR